jgi:hypothetical protein
LKSGVDDASAYPEKNTQIHQSLNQRDQLSRQGRLSYLNSLKRRPLHLAHVSFREPHEPDFELGLYLERLLGVYTGVVEDLGRGTEGEELVVGWDVGDDVVELSRGVAVVESDTKAGQSD